MKYDIYIYTETILVLVQLFSKMQGKKGTKPDGICDEDGGLGESIKPYYLSSCCYELIITLANVLYEENAHNNHTKIPLFSQTHHFPQ